jgi:hypothetical protein
MSSIGPAILGKLLATAGVTTLVGNRIYPEYDFQRQKLYPLLVYKVENVTPLVANDGPSGAETADVVISCIGETYADADNVAFAVQTALDFESGTWAGMTVQGVFLKDDGISDDVVEEPQTEEILYYVKLLSFSVSYNR